MPHIVVKMYAGRSDADKQALTDRIVAVVEETLGYGADAVSVGVEDVAPADWTDRVYDPDVRRGTARLFKRPGYGAMA